jgi:hypothetical protein
MSKDEPAVKDEVVAESTTTESAPVETQETVTADNAFDDDAFDDIDEEVANEAETDGEEEQAPAEPETTEETKPEAQPQDDKPASPEDEWNNLKGDSQDRFRQAINERNELRRKMQELEAKKAQFATEQDLINEINPDTGEPYTPKEIESISWQQSRVAEAERVNQELYESQVRENQLTINDEAARVAKDFSLLNPQSEDFVPEIGQQYVEALNDSLVYALPDGRQANRSTLLANGINPDTQATLVGYNTSPYKLAKLAADAFNRAKAQGETIGQANAQRATEKMLANADAPSGSTGATAKDDSSDFDEAWNEYAA